MTRWFLPGLLAVGVVAILAILCVAYGTTVRAGECAGTWMTASHYGEESGSTTANGEHFTGKAMTAAHKTLAFNTKLRVTYRERSVVVRVNDRGPFIKGRGLDLSTAAARKIGLDKPGVAEVCVVTLR